MLAGAKAESLQLPQIGGAVFPAYSSISCVPTGVGSHRSHGFEAFSRKKS